jgi:hypothetical protein
MADSCAAEMKNDCLLEAAPRWMLPERAGRTPVRPLSYLKCSAIHCNGLLDYFSIAIFVLRKYASDPSH